jgi:hypothetical protein
MSANPAIQKSDIAVQFPAERDFFPAIFCAMKINSFRSPLSARLRRLRNLASVRASRPELPQPLPPVDVETAGLGGVSPS